MNGFEGRKRRQTYVDRGMSGVITIEMSFILPIVLFVFAGIMYTVFYFHDKNIMIGAAAETAVLGAQMERKPETSENPDLSDFYQQRIAGKLILFPDPVARIRVSEGRVTVSVTAEKGRMKLSVQQQAAVVNPERTIRRKRALESIGSE